MITILYSLFVGLFVCFFVSLFIYLFIYWVVGYLFICLFTSLVLVCLFTDISSYTQWRRKLIKSGAAILSMVIKSGAAQQPHWP